MPDRVAFAVDVHLQRARPDADGQDPGPEWSEASVAIVTVAGEIDLATVPELRSTLSEVIAAPHQEVVVDLAEVEFMDASGVGALVGAAAEAARVGVRFRLQALSAPVERVLDLARLDGSLGAGGLGA